MTSITPFSKVYDLFLTKITDDLYLEMTKEETLQDLQNILIVSISKFQFPRFPIFNIDLEYSEEDGETGEIDRVGAFESLLSLEELDILSDLMMQEWINRQIISVDNTRMKYSGMDFKFTSQANHLDKLIKTKGIFEVSNKQKQRLYKRRKITSDGQILSNYSGLSGGALK